MEGVQRFWHFGTERKSRNKEQEKCISFQANKLHSQDKKVILCWVSGAAAKREERNIRKYIKA